MHWLLLIVRYLLRTFSADPDNGVTLAARIDGRIEQRRWGLGTESGWPLFANWRRREHVGRPKVAPRRDRQRSPGRSSTDGSPGGD